MAPSPLLASLSLVVIVLFNGCFAQIDQRPPFGIQSGQQYQHKHRFHSPRECRLENLRAQEPIQRFEAEAGLTEIWDQTDDQFQCAGVALARYTIEPKGLLLPAYSSSPRLFYVVQGRGIQGASLPGCAETYQTEIKSSGSQSRFRDQHQKIRPFSVGDVIAVPAGVAQWIYNRGQSQLILVALFDTRNIANQLDQNLRQFYLAGNPEHEEAGQRRESRRSSQQQRGNIFSGFDNELLSEAYEVDTELIRKMKSEEDERDRIVRVDEDLEELLPERDEDEEQRERSSEHRRDYDNGLEETVCTLRLKHNVGRPDRADVFNPRGGRISTVNSHNLPILRQIQLSAERGVLYSNAMVAPHYTLNGHSVMYVTRGNGRVQVVDNRGESVFDEELKEGQVLIIPQNFVVVKRASDRGLEWIKFKTNDRAITNLLAGRASQIRSLPLGVLTNSFRISREEALRLKQSRREMLVFSPERTQGRRD